VIVNLMGCKTCFIAGYVISNQYHAAHDYPLRVTDYTLRIGHFSAPLDLTINSVFLCATLCLCAFAVVTRSSGFTKSKALERT
jgi:hypothetical protein